MPTTPETRLTFEDFLLLPDDGRRHEIIDGVHHVTPSPNTRHQRLVQRLYLALGGHLASHPKQGEAFIAPLDVVLSFYDVVEPDLVVVAGRQSDIVTEQNIQGPPALVVEVLSKGTRVRDEHLKRKLFDRGGVVEYWLVDPDRDRIVVFRRGTDGHLQEAETVSADGNLTTPLLPGFSVAASTLFVR
jgi:Uma2 family endonuclease